MPTTIVDKLKIVSIPDLSVGNTKVLVINPVSKMVEEQVIGAGDVPTLQAVTETENTTSVGIEINDAALFVQHLDPDDEQRVVIQNDGIRFHFDVIENEGLLNSNGITDAREWHLPDHDGILATFDDITLPNAVANGNTVTASTSTLKIDYNDMSGGQYLGINGHFTGSSSGEKNTDFIVNDQTNKWAHYNDTAQTIGTSYNINLFGTEASIESKNGNYYNSLTTGTNNGFLFTDSSSDGLTEKSFGFRNALGMVLTTNPDYSFFLNADNITADTEVDANDLLVVQGTRVGNPISGDMEFDANERKITHTESGVVYSVSPYYSGAGEFTLGANLSAIGTDRILSINSTDMFNNIRFADVVSEYYSELTQQNDGGIEINSTNPVAYGIRGTVDFSANIGDLDYIQKKYVDDKTKYGAELITFDGIQTVFMIPHGMASTPTSFSISFGDASNLNFVQSLRTLTSTHIVITCYDAPTIGTQTVYWQAFK